MTDPMTVAEVATEIRRSPDTVRRFIRRGELPALNVTPGRGKNPRYLVRRVDFDAFLERLYVTPPVKVERRQRPQLTERFYS